MSSERKAVADGSSPADAHPPVRIDRSRFVERARWLCPNGHMDWSPTNSHIWCKGCRRRYEAGDRDIEAEHYELWDKKTNELVPYSAVELV